ncbi:MAG: hypothetical protein LBU32_19945 [Clostridiales bacterium]|jgi:hypothetical protein|nr:hypothetical protein [Clostridiales bacterium]
MRAVFPPARSPPVALLRGANSRGGLASFAAANAARLESAGLRRSATGAAFQNALAAIDANCILRHPGGFFAGKSGIPPAACGIFLEAETIHKNNKHLFKIILG